MCDILIITINYKAPNATVAFLASVTQLEEFQRAYVMIVENGSEDGSAQHLRPLVAGCANVELMESPTNRGYFGGAKWAFQTYLEKATLPDWVIVCNNDIVFDDPQFLSKLLQRDPNSAGVIAPAIIAELTKADCNPFMRYRPTWLQLLRMRIWHSSYYFMWVKQMFSPYVRSVRHFFSPQLPAVSCNQKGDIYGAHGAFFIFSRSYFEAGGFIDDEHFLYAEELCVAEICHALKLTVLHDQGLRVTHQAHQATGRWLKRDMYEHARGGLQYALDKYFRHKDPACSTERTQSPSAAVKPARIHTE